MSATTHRPPLRAVPFRAPTARLALKPVSPLPGRVELDGAWWPRSRDLTHELAALADVLDPLWAPVSPSTPAAGRSSRASSSSTAIW
ncbi:DUF5994 family protein [Streptomyces gobiensis]|uniref:DUF5994 family protein n=1 Tax=Streptomyces gobiensis TaxID=2875706 RepID=UPI003BB0F109